MGELQHIGNDLKTTVFTLEKYNERKLYWLSTIDEQNEYKVHDRIFA